MTESAQDIAAAYRSLGLVPGADAAQVKAAFRHLAPGLHPDRNPAAPAGGMAALNAAYALVMSHLARRPGVQDYRFALWAPRTGAREHRFETFVPDQPPAAFRPEPRPGAAAPLASAAVDPPAGLGPLADPAPSARPAPAPVAPAPAPPQDPAWRLAGLARDGRAVVYRVEVSGRPDHVVLPLRDHRPCPACQGLGRREGGIGPCPACAGRGGIVSARLMRVELPAAWRPGDRLPLDVPAPGAGLLLELARPARKEA